MESGKLSCHPNIDLNRFDKIVLFAIRALRFKTVLKKNKLWRKINIPLILFIIVEPIFKNEQNQN